MITDRRSSHVVTVGLIDGSVRAGRLARFAPREPDLVLEVSSADGRAVKMPLPNERVAYVAFHRPAGPGASRKTERDLVPRKLHLPGGVTWMVEVNEPSLADRLGFYAVPSEPASPFAEVFVYAHGVLRVETVGLLGAMLVESGALGVEALDRGLQEQASRRGRPVGQILLDQHKVSPEALEEALAAQRKGAGKIGEILIEQGAVDRPDVDAALEVQKRAQSERLGDILVGMKAITEREIAVALATKFNIPFVDLDENPPDPAALQQLPTRLIQRFGALPIRADDVTITVAISDPLATERIEELRKHTKKKLREVVVTAGQLREHTDRLLDQQVRESLPGLDRILEELGGAGGASDLHGTIGIGRAVEVHENDNAVIKLANQIIIDAYRAGASDIHIEPNGAERGAMIRFRIDGDCLVYSELPAVYRRSLVARLKIMAKLDISERRKPQDGKIRLLVHHQQIELRVATLPTVADNEDVVLRILAGAKPLPLDQIGLSARNLGALRALVTSPHGLVLCVGPTGSGKTTTLHSILGSINTVDTKIWTAEDPVEITQAGLRQVQMNEKIGLTFAAALRAFLRADPDVIMVGEMRDEETARVAVEASLTGHLVFSTLHTNSAPETVTRLLDMGLEPFGFGDALLGVVAQRLARALCPTCREGYQGSRAEWDLLASHYGEQALIEKRGGGFGPDFVLYRAVGCEACSRAGYKGRLGLHELLANDERTRALIQRRAPADEIRRAAIERGMVTLAQDAVEKALAGRIDLRQLALVASRPS